MKTTILNSILPAFCKALRNREAATRANVRRLLARLSPGWWTILRDGPEGVTALPGARRDEPGYRVTMSADMGAVEMAALAAEVAEAI